MATSFKIGPKVQIVDNWIDMDDNEVAIGSGAQIIITRVDGSTVVYSDATQPDYVAAARYWMNTETYDVLAVYRNKREQGTL